MKKKIVYLLTFAFLFYPASSAMGVINNISWLNNTEKHPLKVDQAITKIQQETIHSIEKKYDVVLFGIGRSMPNCVVRYICLDFKSYNNLKKEQLTKMLLAFGQELLNNINSNHEIQAYLDHRPFTLKDVSIVIYNSSQGKTIYDPEIAIARLSDGMIIFKTNDPDNEYRYKNITEEKYEDVLKRMQEEEKCQ